jgi:hydrogenase maturation factor
MKQVRAAAKDLGMTIITGHTGTYDCLSTLVGTCTAYGAVDKDRLITPGGAQAGDVLICTKPIGLETVVNFAITHHALADDLFTVDRAGALRDMVYIQTCVEEALLLAGVGGVHAMHDATEGGLVAAVNEMAENADLGFVVDLETLPVLEEAQILQTRFNFTRNELLSLSSTGTLLAAVQPEKEDVVLHKLKNQNVNASSIGAFTKSKKRVLQHRNRTMTFPRIAKDPYAKIMLK